MTKVLRLADLDTTGDELPPVSAIQRQQVSWLWPGRIPRGKVSVLDGDPGLGKSVLTLTIAAKVSTGSPFPDGARPECTDVILLSAEDDVGDTIRPRLEAAGADIDRCRILEEVHLGDEPLRPPEFPTDLERLEKFIVVHGAALVVIDPLMAYLSGTVDSHRDQDVRRVMAGFKRVAERTGAALLIVRHMNKGQGSSALYRGSGSIGIVGAARAGLLVAPDPADEDRRIVAMTKSNLAKMPDALAYRLVEDELYGCARVVWDGTTNHTAAELLQPRVDEDQAPALAEAMRVLKEILTDGPQSAGNIKKQAASAGVAERTLHRAREALGVTTRRQGFGQGGYYVWAMPADPPPPMARGTHGMDAMGATCQGVVEGDTHVLPYPTTTRGGSPDER